VRVADADQLVDRHQHERERPLHLVERLDDSGPRTDLLLVSIRNHREVPQA
jgi:hypothetical protein